MMKFIISLLFFILIFLSNLTAKTITVKCYVDEDHSYSFLIDKELKKVTWLDQDNQNMVISIFPDIEKGGSLLIMGGINSKNEKHTFILDVIKASISVTTNLGFNKSGNCGNKSIFELKDQYKN